MHIRFFAVIAALGLTGCATQLEVPERRHFHCRARGTSGPLE